MWNWQRAKLWPQAHRLAGTDRYDLRHTAATAMIQAGVPLPEIGPRPGHSVDVLCGVYARVFDEGERSNTASEADFQRHGIVQYPLPGCVPSVLDSNCEAPEPHHALNQMHSSIAASSGEPDACTMVSMARSSMKLWTIVSLQ